MANFINEDYVVDFPTFPVLENTMAEAEQLDKENNIEFYCVADIIDVLCKNACGAGTITEEQWMTIISRYPSI